MQRKKKTRDAFAASRGLLKGKYSTREILKFRRQERTREEKELRRMIAAERAQTTDRMVEKVQATDPWKRYRGFLKLRKRTDQVMRRLRGPHP